MDSFFLIQTDNVPCIIEVNLKMKCTFCYIIICIQFSEMNCLAKSLMFTQIYFLWGVKMNFNVYSGIVFS